jgi:hypothetical protein
MKTKFKLVLLRKSYLSLSVIMTLFHFSALGQCDNLIASKQDIQLCYKTEFNQSTDDCGAQPAEQWKVTFYMSNNSGKTLVDKIGGYMTHVELSSNQPCGSIKANINTPYNPGDVTVIVSYILLIPGTSPTNIYVSYYSWGDFSFANNSNNNNNGSSNTNNSSSNTNYTKKSYGNDVVEPNNNNSNQTSGTFDGGTWKKLPNGMYQVITGGDEAEIISAADFLKRFSGNNPNTQSNGTDTEGIKALQDLYDQLDATIKQLKSTDPSTDTRELDSQLQELKKQIDELKNDK